MHYATVKGPGHARPIYRPGTLPKHSIFTWSGSYMNLLHFWRGKWSRSIWSRSILEDANMLRDHAPRSFLASNLWLSSSSLHLRLALALTITPDFLVTWFRSASRDREYLVSELSPDLRLTSPFLRSNRNVYSWKALCSVDVRSIQNSGISRSFRGVWLHNMDELNLEQCLKIPVVIWRSATPIDNTYSNAACFMK